MTSFNNQNTYYFGIIDTLTYFSLLKKGEYLFKKLF